MSQEPRIDSGRRGLTKKDFAAELTILLLRVEKRRGRTISRSGLAKQMNTSSASVYAYLNGTTLPRSEVLERLLLALEVPGEDLGALSTLRDAVEVAQRVRADVVERPALPRPRQLPAATRHFTGRAAQLDRLAAQLRDAPGSAPVITMLCGTAGVGKTTLAVHWAHTVKDEFPDGQLHANLRGFDSGAPADPAHVLRDFLEALGVPPSAIPDTSAGRAALYRTLLVERRILVLLDNVRTADQVRPLLPAAASCLVIVTSRHRLDGLVVREGAHVVPLDVLSHQESLTLLGKYLTPERVAANPVAADDIVTLCARLPLAVSIVAAGAARGPVSPLAALADELRDVHDRLDVLGSWASDIDIRTVFHWSRAVVPDEAGRLFDLLGAHPGPSFDGMACAALLDVTDPPRGALSTLTAAHLVAEHITGRYRFHDLLREYARECFERQPEHVRTGAVRRMCAHYLDAVSSVNYHLAPFPSAAAPHTGSTSTPPTPPVTTYDEAMTWLDGEWPTLRSVIAHAAASAMPSFAWRLAWACNVFLRRTGRRTDREAVHRIALEAAARAGDKLAQATSARFLADAVARLGRRGEALALLRPLVSVFDGAGDVAGAAQTHLSFSRLHEGSGEHEKALHHAEHAVELARRLGDPVTLADSMTAVGRLLGLLDRHEEALALNERALAEYSRLGHLEGQADVLKGLGYSMFRMGGFDRAIACYKQSLALDQRLGDRYWEARGLDALADAHEAAGDTAWAQELRGVALDLLRSLHHPDAERVRSKLA